jgi:hypothetical protein
LETPSKGVTARCVPAGKCPILGIFVKILQKSVENSTLVTKTQPVRPISAS